MTQSLRGLPLIEFRQVTKTYGMGDALVSALRGVSFQIRKGDFVAIMGPSGSGKSTVLNILGGLDRPTSGDYVFDGVSIGELGRTQLALLRRHFIGFVFQGFNLVQRTTAEENVELPLVYRGVPSAERKAAARLALSRVALVGRERHTASELSGGQQQRVAIARALVTRPAVILADEPTGNLDSATSRDIMNLLVKLNSEDGVTIVMVTHEADIAAYARRILRFKDGSLDADEPVVGRAA